MDQNIVVVLFCLLWQCPRRDALTCLECNNVVQPYDCNVVRKCAIHEECYTERKITSDNTVLFDVGCRSKIACYNTNPFGRRNVNLKCSECCDSDLCNLHEHCGSKDAPLAPGQHLCYSCPNGRKTSSDCNVITLCQQDQLCQLQKSHNLFGETRWVTGCGQKSKCSILNDLATGCKNKCCNTNLCNTDCNNTNKSTSGRQIPTTVAATISTTNYQTGPPFGYVGCFVDHFWSRMLNNKIYIDLHHDGITIDKCRNFCHGYKYFGLQSDVECFCGNHLKRDSHPRVEDKECDRPFQGNQHIRLAVYTV